MSRKPFTKNRARNGTPVATRTDEGYGFDLRDSLAAVMRRWRLVIGVTALSAGAAMAYTMSLSNVYEASATVEIDKRHIQIVHIDGIESEPKAKPPTIESEIQVAASAVIARRVIQTLGLQDDPEFSSQSLLAGLARPKAADALNLPAEHANTKYPAPAGDHALSHPSHRLPRGQESVVQTFLAMLTVRRIGNFPLIEVRFRSRDPVKAAHIANTLVEVYIDHQVEQKHRAAKILIARLDEKITGHRERLNASRRKIVEFRSASGLTETRANDLHSQQLSAELEAVIRARSQTAEARARHEQAKRLPLTDAGAQSLLAIVQSDAVRRMRTALSTALRRHAGLSNRYGPLHPEMRRAETDLARARAELRAEMAKVIQSLEVEYGVAAEREHRLEVRFSSLKAEARLTKSQEWKLLELEREAKADQDFYEALLSRKKQAEQTLAIDVPDVEIVAQADVPVIASQPNHYGILLIAIGAALVFAFSLALLLEQMAGGMTNAEHIERAFRLPHLATVPSLQHDRNGVISPRNAVRLMLSQPNSLYADSIREIQNELDWHHHHQGSRIVLVTSAISGEGKSLIASNLAHNLAMMGCRTLLVDADMRKQSLTSLLDAVGHNGLFEILCKGQPVDGAILRDDTTGLSFMPAASLSTTGAPPAEIIDSRRTRALLERLKTLYDVVIVDAPPLLPVADARMLAKQADQILLAMNGAATPKRLVHRALRLLGRNIRKVAGIVLNRAAPSAPEANKVSGSTPGHTRHRLPPPVRTAA